MLKRLHRLESKYPVAPQKGTGAAGAGAARAKVVEWYVIVIIIIDRGFDCEALVIPLVGFLYIFIHFCFYLGLPMWCAGTS